MEVNKCCKGFISRLNKKKEKGFSIEYKLEKDKLEYYLEFNSVDTDIKEVLINAFRKYLKGIKLPNLALQGSVHISYCPWCGKKL